MKPSEGLPQPFAASYNLFGAGMAAGRSAIPAESVTTGARLAEVQTQDIAGAILDTMNANPQPISKALPVGVIFEEGRVSEGFLRLLKAVNDPRVYFYHTTDETELAAQAKVTFEQNGLERYSANVVPVQNGEEILPQLLAIPGFEKNSRVLFTDTTSADFASSIEEAQLKDGPARFIVTPDRVQGVKLTPQEYLAVLYVAAARLTALGQPSDYTNPAILSIFRSGWAKFIALPIKLLEELRKAAQSLRTSAVAA